MTQNVTDLQDLSAAAWKCRVLAHDQQTPRYTSYPPSPHFRNDFPSETYATWLSQIRAGETLSLYVHVPFCAQMCWYCGCHTKITQRYGPIEDYLHLLLREIHRVGEHVAEGARVTHLHFGGGTPSMLQAKDLLAVVQTLRESFTFDPQAEIAIELDPRTASPDKIAALGQAGFTRASLGVQDFNDNVLEAVNRPQPFSLVYKVAQQLRDVGIARINVDLMYGLPHQTVRSMQRNIDYLRLIDPDRVAVFGYAHVPWMKKHMELINESALPDAGGRYDLFDVASRELEDAGYLPVGIDHFAKADDDLIARQKEGRLARNFQGYTPDQADALLGFGVSSIGRVKQGYIQNFADQPRYREALLAGHLPTSRGYEFTGDDLLRAAVIERLMCDLAVDLGAVCSSLGASEDYLDDILPALDPLIAEGIIILTGPRRLTVAPPARALTRLVATAFDRFFQPSTARHAKTV